MDQDRGSESVEGLTVLRRRLERLEAGERRRQQRRRALGKLMLGMGCVVAVGGVVLHTERVLSQAGCTETLPAPPMWADAPSALGDSPCPSAPVARHSGSFEQARAPTHLNRLDDHVAADPRVGRLAILEDRPTGAPAATRLPVAPQRALPASDLSHITQ